MTRELLNVGVFRVAIYRNVEYLLSPWQDGSCMGFGADGSFRTFDVKTPFTNIISLPELFKCNFVHAVTLDSTDTGNDDLTFTPKEVDEIAYALMHQRYDEILKRLIEIEAELKTKLPIIKFNIANPDGIEPEQIKSYITTILTDHRQKDQVVQNSNTTHTDSLHYFGDVPASGNAQIHPYITEEPLVDGTVIVLNSLQHPVPVAYVKNSRVSAVKPWRYVTEFGRGFSWQDFTDADDEFLISLLFTPEPF